MMMTIIETQLFEILIQRSSYLSFGKRDPQTVND